MIVLDRKTRMLENGSRHNWARLQRAVVRLANARELADLRALVKSFPDLMPPGMERVNWQAPLGAQDRAARAALERMVRVQLKLRAAWKLPHGMLREQLLIELAGDYIGRALKPALDTFVLTAGVFEKHNFPLLPQHNEKVREIEGALRQRHAFVFVLTAALRAAPKMRICGNLECPHPFYLRSEGGKRFCSRACAAPSQRAAKLKWWNAHKAERLARRRAEYRKRSKRAPRRKKSNRREKRQ